MVDYSIIFMTGVLVSLHCIGMCGAIVLAYSIQPQGTLGATRPPRWLSHTAYNAGRILAYAVLGGLLGVVGMTISGFERMAEVVAIISGAVMIVGGVAMLELLPLRATLRLGGIAKVHARLLREHSLAGTFAMGVLTPLLPCGILYAMLARAAASGSMADGALTMGVFGLGMAPSLMVFGTSASFFSARLRKGAERVAAVAIIVMGTVLVLRGLHVPFAHALPAGNIGGASHECCSE